MESADLEITIESRAQGRSRVVTVRGELDSGTCEALETDCRRAIDEHGVERLTLDLGAVSFIDSAGMRTMILIEQSARERDVRLVMVPPPGQVTALLRAAGVTQHITLSADPSIMARRAEFSERATLELPREQMSPKRARAEVRELMSDRLEEEVAELVLLTSEVVTNAVVHAPSAGRTPITLRIIRHEDGVRIEVEDGGDGFDPAWPHRAPEAGGKGLLLVDTFATNWGACQVRTERGPRFCVWFEVDWSARLTAEAARA